MNHRIFSSIFVVMSVFMTGSCVSTSPSSEIKCDKLVAFRLADIHDLWGGYSITILNDGKTYVREVKVENGRKERRFESKLSAAEFNDLKQFIIQAGYFGFREKRLYRGPDGARPGITACFDGKCLSSAKWAGYEDKRFDLVYDRLLDMAHKIAKQRPIWAGKLDPNMWPPFLKTN